MRIGPALFFLFQLPPDDAPRAASTTLVRPPCDSIRRPVPSRRAEVGGERGEAAHAAAASRVVKQARTEGVKVIFFQPQFDVRAAGAIAEAIEGAAAPIDSLAPDVEKNLDEIAAKIRQSLSRPRGNA